MTKVGVQGRDQSFLEVSSAAYIKGFSTSGTTLGKTLVTPSGPLPGLPFWSHLLLVARAIRNAIQANRFARIIRNWNPYFYSASGRFAQITRISDSCESPDSRESCESIRANHATKHLLHPQNVEHSAHTSPSTALHMPGTTTSTILVDLSQVCSTEHKDSPGVCAWDEALCWQGKTHNAQMLGATQS